MLWSKEIAFYSEPFESEPELEEAILEVADTLFGETGVYLDAKRKIGVKGPDQKHSRRVPH